VGTAKKGVLEGDSVVFILSDQNFPPSIPSKNECECLRIIRGEHASLGELLDLFLEIVKGIEIKDGTVILLSSATHLGHAGIEVYANELRRVIGKFGEIFGQSVTVIPGIPVFLDGSDDSALARNLAEMGFWLSKISETKTHFLEKSFGLVLEVLKEDNPVILGDRRKVSLPIGLNDPSNTIWESPGGTCRNGVPPISAENEVRIIKSLVLEINEKFGLDISLNPALSRNDGKPGLKKNDFCGLWLQPCQEGGGGPAQLR
jgi:hypothetical protein